MAGEANQAEFTGARRDQTYAYAMGWNGKGSSSGAFRGGIADPQEMKVKRGQVLYRFGHSNLWDVVNQSSPWWMLDQTFLEIANRADEAGTDLVQLARMKLALTPDFGTCNRIFAALLRAPLRALVGRGRIVMEDPDPQIRARQGRPIAWLAGYEVPQLFIPGLRDWGSKPPGLSAVAQAAMVYATPEHVSTWVSVRSLSFPLI